MEDLGFEFGGTLGLCFFCDLNSLPSKDLKLGIITTIILQHLFYFIFSL